MLYFIIALFFGSFLNVMIFRIPRGESLLFPPSHCPFCRHRLGGFDLIPVLSFLCLKGRCRYCKTRINPRYPLVELLTGLVTLLWSKTYHWNPPGIMMLLFIYLLLVIGLIDFEHKIIPNVLIFPALVISLFFRLGEGQISVALTGGLVAGGLLYAIAFIYPQGMGMGDVKLMLLTGILLGWERALLAIFLGSIAGTLILLPLLLLKKITRKTPVPFGPFLALAILLIILGGDVVLLSGRGFC